MDGGRRPPPGGFPADRRRGGTTVTPRPRVVPTMQVVPHTDDATAEPLPGVRLAQLAAGDRMSLQHFAIEPGAEVEVHHHHHEQLGYLVSGALEFLVDGEPVPVERGDSYVIPGDEPHGARNPGDEPAVGVELFSPPRPEPPWLEE